jgi:hypothetical protein
VCSDLLDAASVAATWMGAARRPAANNPDRQLVIVRYQAQHDPLQEWVYNGADIDGSKVIWARDMGPEQNEELIRYYRDRRVWVVEVDDRAAKVEAYPMTKPNTTSKKISMPLSSDFVSGRQH